MKFFPSTTFLKLIVGLAVLNVIFFSCKDDESIQPDQSVDQSFFPLKIGFWTEYTVDSIIHLTDDDAFDVDSSKEIYRFSIREEIDSSYIAFDQSRTFVILRYKRENDSLPWSLVNVWTAMVDELSAQKVEDNIRFIKMKFPISPSSAWNGNAYNFFPKEEYSYDHLFQSYQVNALDFDSTVTVVQNDFVSNVNRITKMEVFGSNIGLLDKQLDSVRTKNTINGTIILNGLEYRQSITNYKR